MALSLLVLSLCESAVTLPHIFQGLISGAERRALVVISVAVFVRHGQEFGGIR